MTNSQKVVVFDLDETLGNFIELGMFCDSLETIRGIPIPEAHFFEIIDLFSECLRPDIIKILSYLKGKKQKGECEKIMIYTNNQGPKEWTVNISKYFNNKLNTKLFDDIVAAFKVNGKRVELCRTSHDKSVDDLIKCTKIPSNTKICFLDDQYHPYMKHSNVYYINVKPYEYNYSFEDMAERYYNTYGTGKFARLNSSFTLEKFTKQIVRNMNRYNFTVVKKTAADLNIDTIISKRIIEHLKSFFKDKWGRKYTQRKKINNKHSKTRRKTIT